MTHGPTCQVILAYESHGQSAFTKTIIDSLKILKRIGPAAFGWEEAADKTLEQIISEYEKLASLLLPKFYDVPKYRVQLLTSITGIWIPSSYHRHAY